MSTKFCPQCESIMTKSTATGAIVFQCRCQLQLPGAPEDTLMAEGYLETTESNLKHEVFIDNAPFDQAAYKVHKTCPSCGLDFLVQIRIGSQASILYSCSCGWRATLNQV